jgi:phosphoribosylformimino-5-aminoimidazole carboxamide ribotide isomerase
LEIIPVLDIMHGLVVRARGGDRAAYAPIETPLARSSDPVDVAQGYLTLYPFRRLYVADLDGIEGRERCTGILARLKAELPLIELWVDNGMNKRQDCSAFAGLDLGRLVLGSESQSDPALPLASGGVLSLDFRGETFLGPRALLDEPDLWPQDVIVMTLARVGASEGPDVERVAKIRERSSRRRVFAAGGVRNVADLLALRDAGAAGALVASALHDGRISPHDVAALSESQGDAPS